MANTEYLKGFKKMRKILAELAKDRKNQNKTSAGVYTSEEDKTTTGRSNKTNTEE